MKALAFRFILRSAALASAATLMGAQLASAAPFSNQIANVFARSRTTVNSSQNTSTTNVNTTVQIGGPLQNATSIAAATTTSTSTINATSGNVVVVVQQ